MDLADCKSYLQFDPDLVNYIVGYGSCNSFRLIRILKLIHVPPKGIIQISPFLYKDALTCLSSSEIKLSSLKEKEPGQGGEEEGDGDQQVRQRGRVGG